jgi:hypothetical protein
MITKEQVLEAIELLNAAEIGIKIKTARAKEEDLRENFLATVDELLEAKKQKSIPEKVAVIYNALVEEENEKAEEAEAPKEKAVKAPKEKKEKAVKEPKEKAVKAPKEKTEGKKESRPQALKRKMETIPELEDLLNDKELLTIYNGRKAWIRNDFNKLPGSPLPKGGG